MDALKDEQGLLLDLGCSFNPWIEEYKKWDGFIGVDLSLMALRVGGLVDSANSGRLVNSNAHFLPFHNTVFHAVVSSEVLEHVPQPALVIQEINRVLRNKTIAVISVPMNVVDKLELEHSDLTH